MTFNDYVTLTDNVPQTIMELILARIAEWTMSTDGAENTALKAQYTSSWRVFTVAHCIIRPESDIVMGTAHRNVRNGVVDQTAWVAGDLTNAEPLSGGTGEKSLNSPNGGNTVDIGSRVLFQNSGGDVKVWLDVAVN